MSSGDPMAEPPEPTIHAAEPMPGPSGAVWFGPEITFDQAVALRAAGLDVVVRGDDTDANRGAAYRIEAAVGPPTRPQNPHRRAGPNSLPHFHQLSRVPDGHTFYETDNPAKESAEAALRYFTPELIELLGSGDEAAAREADAEWDRRQEAYERELDAIEPLMPPHIREFSQLLLHDARVQNIARQGDRLIMVLHKQIPPRHLVILTYDLAGEPVIDKEALPALARSPVMCFEYDELEMAEDGGRPCFRQSILFSNGWEMRLSFTDVRAVLAEPLFAGQGDSPLPGAA